MADGALYHSHRGVYKLDLCLQHKDRAHIESYGEFIGKEPKPLPRRSPISTPQGVLDPKEYPQMRVSVGRKGLADDLLPWGVIPRKSYNFSEPQVDKGLLPHFLRGLIDGDGTVRWTPGSKSIRLLINPDARDWVISALRSCGYRGHIGEYDSSYNGRAVGLQISGKNNCLEIKNLLHANAGPRLARKWNKIQVN